MSIREMQEHTFATHMNSSYLDNIYQALTAFFAARGVAAWLVGGTVRDLLMGCEPNDIDIAVDGDGVVLARDFADSIGGSFVELDQERGTGRIVCASPTRLIIDIVQLRAPTLEEDLRLRDFSINALAVACNVVETLHAMSLQCFAPRNAIIDPCGGQQDILARKLRPCGPTIIQDDPLRMLRAVRLAAELDMQITPELDHAIRQSGHLIDRVSPERIRDELLKLLSQPHATPWLRYLDDVAILTHIFPELEPARLCDQPNVHFLPVLAHMLETVACVEWLLEGQNPRAYCQLPVAVQCYPDLTHHLPFAERVQAHLASSISSGYPRIALLKLATLLHDVAKPQTKQPKPEGGVSFYGHQEIGAQVAFAIAQRLRLSRQEAKYLAQVIHEHMRLGQLRTAETLTLRAINRLFRDMGDAALDSMLHDLADHLATRGPNIDPSGWQTHLDWINALLTIHWSNPEKENPPLINGHDLIEIFHIEPGKVIGTILREIREAQMVGDIHTREEALNLAQKMLREEQIITISYVTLP